MSTQGLILSFITIVAWGIGSVLDKYAIGAFPSALSLVSLRAVIIGGIFLVYGLLSGRVAEVAATPGWAVLVAVVAALIGPIIGQVTYYMALRVDEVSRVVPVTSSYPLVLALLSVVILGEKLTWAKGLGIVLVVAGVLLISGVLTSAGGGVDS